jgi:predicted RNA-binding protein associated with RNAse of E/G family
MKSIKCAQNKSTHKALLKLSVNDQVSVHKLNIDGQTTWEYSGKITEIGKDYLTLEAYFDQPDTEFHGMFLGRGDRFLETYFTNRWYNIFEIHARDNDHIRGWYCNIGCPVSINGDTISYIDLALDLLIFPNGRQIVLDEEEFNTLNISQEMQQRSFRELEDLKKLFSDQLNRL